MVVVIVTGGVAVPLASADDDDVDLDATRLADRYAAKEPPEPALRLAPMLSANTEGLGTIETHHTRTLQLG